MNQNHTSSVNAYIEKVRDRIVAVLPPNKNPGLYVSTVKEYLFRNPDLFQCEVQSLTEAIVDAALLGLELGPPFDLAVIGAFNDNRQNMKLANLIVEYRGHMIQVYRTGKVKAIEARAVYQEDQFEYEFGKNPRLVHQPCIFTNRGPLVYAYSIAQLTDGGSAMEVINKNDADKARDDSPGANHRNSIWNKRPSEMWCKTAIKKLVNRLPRNHTPDNFREGSDPPTIPSEVKDLFNAVIFSPELYKQALAELEIEFPVDVISIRAVLAHMRTLYRTKTGSGNQKE